MHRSSMTRARRLSGNALTVFPAALLIGSAAAKFAHVKPVVTQLAQLGFFDGRLTFIAVAELASAILFIIPRTRAIGLLLVSAFLGGAIAAHMGHGEAIYQPAFILALFWIGTVVRNPEAVWSLTSERHDRFVTVEQERVAA